MKPEIRNKLRKLENIKSQTVSDLEFRYSNLFRISLFGFLILLIIVGVSFAHDASAAATISSPMNNLGLVGYWNFNTGKGTDIAWDLSGNGNNGKLTSMDPATDWVDGKSGNGQALDLSGDADYVSSSIALPTFGSYSIWFKFNAVPGGTAQVLISSTQWGHVGVGFIDSNIFTNGSSDFLWTADTNWHNIVVVYTTSSQPTVVYLDGTSLTTNGDTGNTNANQSNLNIGARNDAGSLSFNGQIDEVRIYNRALSGAEIKRLYLLTQPKISTNQLDNGLVGYWDFNFGKGGAIAFDKTSNGNNGRLTSMDPATDWVDGKNSRLGQALDFDGSNDYVSGTSINLSNSPLTISAWIKPKPNIATDRVYFSIGSVNAQNQAIHLRQNNDTALWFGMWNDDLAITGVPNMANVWSHIVFSLNSSKVQTAYFNGSPIGSRTASALFSGNSDWNIGRLVATSAENWNGQIDDVRIYNRALTAEEIKRLYLLGL